MCDFLYFTGSREVKAVQDGELSFRHQLQLLCTQQSSSWEQCWPSARPSSQVCLINHSQNSCPLPRLLCGAIESLIASNYTWLWAYPPYVSGRYTVRGCDNNGWTAVHHAADLGSLEALKEIFFVLNDSYFSWEFFSTLCFDSFMLFYLLGKFTFYQGMD